MRRSAGMLSRGGSETDADMLQVCFFGSSGSRKTRVLHRRKKRELHGVDEFEFLVVRAKVVVLCCPRRVDQPNTQGKFRKPADACVWFMTPAPLWAGHRVHASEESRYSPFEQTRRVLPSIVRQYMCRVTVSRARSNACMLSTPNLPRSFLFRPLSCLRFAH